MLVPRAAHQLARGLPTTADRATPTEITRGSLSGRAGTAQSKKKGLDKRADLAPRVCGGEMTSCLPSKMAILSEEGLAGKQHPIQRQEAYDPVIRTRQRRGAVHHRAVTKARAAARIGRGVIRSLVAPVRRRTRAGIRRSTIAHRTSTHVGRRLCQARKRAGQQNGHQQTNCSRFGCHFATNCAVKMRPVGVIRRFILARRLVGSKVEALCPPPFRVNLSR